jgi:hypothetical protein
MILIIIIIIIVEKSKYSDYTTHTSSGQPRRGIYLLEGGSDTAKKELCGGGVKQHWAIGYWESRVDWMNSFERLRPHGPNRVPSVWFVHYV